MAWPVGDEDGRGQLFPRHVAPGFRAHRTLDERTVNAPHARRKAPLVAASCSPKDTDYYPQPLPKNRQSVHFVCVPSLCVCAQLEIQKKVIVHVPD